MDLLTLIGHGLFFTIGVAVGTALMYFGGEIIDRINEQEERT